MNINSFSTEIFNNIVNLKEFFKTLLVGNKKNLMVLSGGTLISQIFPFLLSPVLTRLYNPDQFATLELVMRITSFFAVMATLRFDIAIPLPGDDKKAINLFSLSIISSISVSVLCLLLFAIFQTPINSIINNPEFKDWLLYIPILVLFSGISQSGNYVLLRESRYRVISFAKIADSLINNIGKISLAFILSASLFGLIFPNFIGLFVTALIPLIAMKRNWISSLFKTKYIQLRDTFKEYIEFPKVNFPNAIIDVFQIGLVVIIISHYFGAIALGLYALKLRILKTPTIIIGNSAGQIFYQTTSKIYAKGESIKALFVKYLRYFAIIGVLTFIPFIFAGPIIFSFVFGSEWRVAGELAQYTAPWMFLNFLSSALSYTPVILKRQKTVLLFSLFNLCLVVACWLIGFHIFENLLNTIGLLSLVESIYFIVVIIWYYKIASESGHHV